MYVVYCSAMYTTSASTIVWAARPRLAACRWAVLRRQRGPRDSDWVVGVGRSGWVNGSWARACGKARAGALGQRADSVGRSSESAASGALHSLAAGSGAGSRLCACAAAGQPAAAGPFPLPPAPPSACLPCTARNSLPHKPGAPFPQGRTFPSSQLPPLPLRKPPSLHNGLTGRP